MVKQQSWQHFNYKRNNGLKYDTRNKMTEDVHKRGPSVIENQNNSLVKNDRFQIKEGKCYSRFFNMSLLLNVFTIKSFSYTTLFLTYRLSSSFFVMRIQVETLGARLKLIVGLTGFKSSSSHNLCIRCCCFLRSFVHCLLFLLRMYAQLLELQAYRLLLFNILLILIFLILFNNSFLTFIHVFHYFFLNKFIKIWTFSKVSLIFVYSLYLLQILP